MILTLFAETWAWPLSVRIAGATPAMTRAGVDSSPDVRGLACGGAVGSSTQNCQPGGAGGQEGSGCHPGGGSQSAGGSGQFGGQLYRFKLVSDMSP